MTSKECIKCSKNLDISKFNNKSLSKDGYDNICRECYKIVRRKYKQKQEIQTLFDKDIQSFYEIEKNSNESLIFLNKK